jgi:hypothetical protein
LPVIFYILPPAVGSARVYFRQLFRHGAPRRLKVTISGGCSGSVTVPDAVVSFDAESSVSTPPPLQPFIRTRIYMMSWFKKYKR